MYRIQVRRRTQYGVSSRTRTLPSDGDKPWYWRIVAANGHVILTSETYASKGNAVKAARKFRRGADGWW